MEFLFSVAEKNIEKIIMKWSKMGNDKCPGKYLFNSKQISFNFSLSEDIISLLQPS